MYHVVVEDLALSYQPSLYMYWILPMCFVVEQSFQIGLYQMIYYPMMIWWIETMIQCWEQEVVIQTLMKIHFCYTNRDNYEVKLQHAIVVVPVETYTHQPCIHKCCNFHSWLMAVAWYLTYKVKSDQVLKKLATLALCYVKSCPQFVNIHPLV